MRTRFGVLVIVASLISAAACSDAPAETEVPLEEESPATTQSTTTTRSTTTTDVPALESIPPGTYSRVILRDEAISEGFDAEMVDAMLGPDGEMPVAIEITADRWTHHVTNDAGFREIGDLGTYTYDDEGNWVTTGCCGTGTFSWSLQDDVLTLTLMPPFEEDSLLVTTGEFRLEGSSSGADADVVTLDVANTLDDLPAQIQAVLVDARDISGESLDFEPSNRYAFGSSGYSGAEAVVVEDIRSGQIAMGWVGARALPGFEPLLAPMLVDSYELQFQLFEDGIPQTMFSDPDITVIAVLPGPMRKIMGVDRPFLQVGDFAGQTIAGDATPVAEDTMRVLGATPVPAASGMSLDGIDGLQAQLAAISGNGYETFADSVTTNLNLWPRPLVIIMNTEVFEELSPDQQESLMTAGRNSINAAREATLAEDAQASELLCASDLAVLEMSTADLAAIFDAVQPVYATLEENSQFAASIEEITSVKEELGAPPATLRCD